MKTTTIIVLSDGTTWTVADDCRIIVARASAVEELGDADELDVKDIVAEVRLRQVFG